MFLATDLSESERAATSAEELAMTIGNVAFPEIEARIAARDIVDAKSIIGLLLAREFLAGDFPGI